FLQRAGRSGHQHSSTSRAYFVPTNVLELIKATALKTAAVQRIALESCDPILNAYDILIQYLVTLAVSEGFAPDKLFEEITSTFAYQTLSRKEWNRIMRFITSGGDSLGAYDEYSKVVEEDDLFKVN